MTNNSTAVLSDRELLDAAVRAAGCERQSTAELISLLAELDTRKLYLGEGYSSLFTYVTLALHLSEPAAYSRITAARTARRFPVILTMLAQGALMLTTIGLLTAHLTDENHEALLSAVRQKSKRDVEQLVACLSPQPDIASRVRKMAAPTRANREMRPVTGHIVNSAARPVERCAERAFLEFHHVRPFADGGATVVGNLQLRCRAHNAYEAARYFGDEQPAMTHP